MSRPRWWIRSSRGAWETLIERLKLQLGFTSIVVTHDMCGFAERLADLVLFLDQGRARFFGTLADFWHHPTHICSSSWRSMPMYYLRNESVTKS